MIYVRWPTEFLVSTSSIRLCPHLRVLLKSCSYCLRGTSFYHQVHEKSVRLPVPHLTDLYFFHYSIYCFYRVFIIVDRAVHSLCSHFSKLCTLKWFSEKIRPHFFSWTICNINFTLLDTIGNKEITNFYMLCLL